MLLLGINLDISKDEAIKVLTSKALELGYKPARSVIGTEDEPYNLISQLLTGIVTKEVQLRRE